MCMSMVMMPVSVSADSVVSDKSVSVTPAEVGYTGIASSSIIVYKVTNNKTDGTGTVSAEGFVGFTSMIDLNDPTRNLCENVIIPATVTLLDGDIPLLSKY